MVIDAIVYFSAREGVTGPLDLLLHRDFRHCGVVVFSDMGGIMRGVQFDPGARGSVVRTWLAVRQEWQNSFARQTEHLRNAGYQVAIVRGVTLGGRRSRFPLCTCVEQVKRLIGVSSFWIWTPRQLWRHLNERG